MNIPETVIKRFFNGECNEEEEQQVKLYFINNPGELEKYMTEESWQNTEAYPMPGNLSAAMLHHIEKNTGSRLMPVMARLAAAAAVVFLLAGAAWLWIQQSHMADRTQQFAAAATDTTLTEQVNNTAKMMLCRLGDGTIIELEPHGKLAYHQPFKNGSREVYLQGNALFRVKSSKASPFTVHTSQAATVALGTVFRVNEDNHRRLQVKLYSGKVKVQHSRIPKDENLADIYLVPGQQLTFTGNNPAPELAFFEEKKQLKQRPAGSSAPATTLFTFNDESLESIFSRLQNQQKGVFIKYDKDIVDNMSFTGSFQPGKETMDSFLETISLLNGLTVSKENNIYHITR